MSVNGNISSMQKPNSRFATSIIPQQSFEKKEKSCLQIQIHSRNSKKY